MQCLSSQNLSSTASISSCADLNNTKKYSFISVEPSTQLQEMTIVNSQIGIDVPLNDPRTLILPKVSPCK
ncbi:hypothetical protein LIER_28888 [Lithospermum erythrorhizon]|uniref:Uncharacterized protein n=1 Tax=Lithospermum erythrorhizon TaxID=34254 RepID=A0AAV3RHC2_LITER